MKIYTKKKTPSSPKAHLVFRLVALLLALSLAVFFIFYGKYFEDFLRLIGLRASVEEIQQATVTLTTVEDFEGLTDAAWNTGEGTNFSDTVAITNQELRDRNLTTPPEDPGTDGLVLPDRVPPAEKGEEGIPPGGGVKLPFEPAMPISEYSYATPWIDLGENHRSLTRLLALEYAPRAAIMPPETDTPGIPLISYSYHTVTTLADAQQAPLKPFLSDSGIAPDQISTRILEFAGETDRYVQIKVTMVVETVEELSAVYELTIDHNVVTIIEEEEEEEGGGGIPPETPAVEVTVRFDDVNLPDKAAFLVYGAQNKNIILDEGYDLTQRRAISFTYLTNVLTPGDYMVSINDQEGSNIKIKEKLAMFSILENKFSYDVHLGTFEQEEQVEGLIEQLLSGADLNGDGVVNTQDFAIMMLHWGEQQGGS